MASLLDEKDLKKLKKDMKSYTREFEINDRALSLNQNKEEVERRRDILARYQNWHKNRMALINSHEKIAQRKVKVQPIFG